MGTKFKRILVFSALLGSFLFTHHGSAIANVYTQINLSNINETEPLAVSITQAQSAAYHWKPGEKIRIQAYVERKDGRKEFLKDRMGNASWEVTLNANQEAVLSILPAANNFSGRITMKGNGKIFYVPTPYLAESFGKVLEKVYEYRFDDGARIKVYFTDQFLEESGESDTFVKEVLDAAVSAYQTITQFQGFNTPGFSFASPDKRYVTSPDRTVHIYLGDSKETNRFPYHGFNALAFKDAPCFETVRLSETAFRSVILLPVNYKEFIRNWEKLNPSPLGTRNANVDLRGTLIHEMLHVILFHYNKNLNKETDQDKKSEAAGGINPAGQKKVDWYVEGLARYFETFAGARHDFYSQGFRQTLPDKIRFSRGGSNYFMRYPDQAFTNLRYENALFWRFIDHRFGMAAIERLSRDFRGSAESHFHSALEKTTGVSFNELLKEYAVSILLKDFGLKDDSDYLKDVARTRLLYQNSGLYLLDGFGAKKLLGPTCRTDWIGAWGDERAKFGDPPVAGDNTDESDVSGWATDFYQIDIAPGTVSLPRLGIEHKQGGLPLAVQVLIVSKGGSILKRQMEAIPPSRTAWLELNAEIKKDSLAAKDIEKIYVLITNTDPKVPAEYEIQTKI